MYLKNYVTKDMTTQLKAVAISLVILGHLDIIPRAGAWGVGIFLLISGYGLTQSYSKNGLDDFFKKRVLAVMLPYSIVTMLWIVIDFTIGERYEIKTIITSIMGLNFKSTVDITMWYIPFLMIWYIAFFIVFKYLKNNYIKVLSLFIFSGVIYTYWHEIFDINVGVQLYTLLFPIGVLISFMFSKDINISEMELKHIVGGILIISYLVFEISKNKSDIHEFYKISIIAASVLFLSIGIILYDLKSKILMFIGSISFELYLFEGVFINKYRFIFDNISNKFISIILYILFILFISILYRKIMKKTFKLQKIIGESYKTVIQ